MRLYITFGFFQIGFAPKVQKVIDFRSRWDSLGAKYKKVKKVAINCKVAVRISFAPKRKRDQAVSKGFTANIAIVKWVFTTLLTNVLT